MIGGRNVGNKADVGYLGAKKELANCGLRFSSFKTNNTLRRLNLKVEKTKTKQKSYKEDSERLTRKMQSTSNVSGV